jgi:hypothetical protein
MHSVMTLISFLNLERIEQLDSLIERKLKEKGLTDVKTFKIPSSKDPNVEYKVVNDNGYWECDCPSFTYTGGKECKHIREAKTK